MPGIDTYTKLLLHCNGTDGSQTFTDDSDSAHTGVANGTAQLDTDYKKFGTASGLFDGNSDWVQFADSTDWQWNGDFTLDFWVRFNSTSGNQCFIGRPTSGGSYFYFALEDGGIRIRDYPGGYDVNFGVVYTFAVDTWYHLEVSRDGNNWRFFVDGVQKGSTIVNSGSAVDRTGTSLQVGANSAIGYLVNGWMDEVRISKGIARHTSNFTPSTEEYNEFDVSLADSMQISDSIEVADTVPKSFESIQLSDTVAIVGTNQDAKYATKIISVNPLVFVTDTDPVEIVRVDTTDPANLTWNILTLYGISNANDFDVNESEGYIYVGGASGKVIKININDFFDRTVIDTGDSDDILFVEINENAGVTYASTDSATGELYLIDERSTFIINSNLEAVSLQQFKIPSQFNIVSAYKLNSNFQALSYNYYKIKSDFKCLTKEVVPIENVDDITPIKLEDFEVYINGSQLTDTDLVLSSISIVHNVGQESTASFELSRKHDQLDTTLEGVSSVITNQNDVIIKIKGHTEFSGKVSELDCQYQNDREYVVVNALAEEKTNKFDTITLSLPSTNGRFSLYDIMLQNPRIYNPYVDPSNEDNPKKYKGIRVDLGTKITQSVSKWTIFDSSGSIATAIREGTFNPYQNWTYFWSPTVKKLGETSLGDTTAIRFFYIGTSLAPVSEDLWQLENAYHWRQRKYDDEEEELGYYEVGEAPFKEISCRNGQKITKPYLTDETNGLYSITDASYNFIDYAKEVADLEYENLKNINGDILPDTSCSFTLTVDGYLYYGISLLTRINIDNTTTSNIYNNSNGFPVSVKTITITSSDRKVALEADNTKSQVELDVINDQFPDDEDEEYNEEEKRVLIAVKTDMRTRLQVQ